MNGMDINVIKKTLNLNDVGQDMVRLVSRLYPICRSITGNGFRETLNIIKEQIPLQVYEIPTGTKVFDWTVPKEWNIKDAHVKNSAGDRVIDFKKSNLHVVGYSMPIRKRVSRDELKEHLFTLPGYPDWIPYRTSYYKEDWGFCLSHNQFLTLKDEEYEVCIDSSMEEGHLTYGEFSLAGETGEEILLSCHTCHPSLCNDNLSGIALAVFLAKFLSSLSLRYTYRFLFIPGTIGSITWLAMNEKEASRIKHGLVVACVGDPGKTTYKKSRQGDAEIDQAVIHVLKESGEEFEVIDFFPYGYDERQYCSPGFNLPVGCLMRTPHARYPEYHTSADNLDLVRQEYLENSFIKYFNTFCLLEGNRKYINTNAKCEPQLGRRGLYDTIGGIKESATKQLAMLWVLNLSDGQNSLLDIAERSNIKFDIVKNAADALVKHHLLIENVP
jgi:aminopeptidase-like protein